MIATFARSHGAPCPTVVLDGRTLPEADPELLGALAGLRSDMSEHGAGDILKNAIIWPSKHPLFDLDYRFVQSLPRDFDSFDLRGSCGHSILAAVEVAARTGMIQPLIPGCRVRVNVLNNGDNVVCETEETSDGGTRFTAHFLCSPPRPIAELLTTGEPVSLIPFEGGTVPVSLVTMGNSYIFVSGTELGVNGTDELFTDDPGLFRRMLGLRLAVCEEYGWDPSGAFPKIAALLPESEGVLAVRAISVPSWHPTVAMTGATCLATAVGIEGTVPWALAAEAGHQEGLLSLRTAGGPMRVSAYVTGEGDSRRLAWVSVAEKQVDFRGDFPLPHQSVSTSAALTEESSWLPLTA